MDKCQICRQPIEKRNNAQKYCFKCSKEQAKKQRKEYKKRHRQANRKVRYCVICDGEILNLKRKKTCGESCYQELQKIYNRLYRKTHKEQIKKHYSSYANTEKGREKNRLTSRRYYEKNKDNPDFIARQKIAIQRCLAKKKLKLSPYNC